MPRSPFFPLFAAISVATGICAPISGAYADDEDHETARTALQQHKALPLAVLLKQVRPQLGGRIVGTELEHEDETYIYEFKIVTPDGRLQEIYVNALTGEILKEGGSD